MFKEAARLKVRFNTEAGTLTVEDLFDIPLTSERGVSLDNIARGLNRKMKDAEEESFVSKPSAQNRELKLKFEIVKDVIATKIEERDKKKVAASRKKERELLAGILERKQFEQLEGMTAEEIQARIDELSEDE